MGVGRKFGGKKLCSTYSHCDCAPNEASLDSVSSSVGQLAFESNQDSASTVQQSKRGRMVMVKQKSR